MVATTEKQSAAGVADNQLEAALRFVLSESSAPDAAMATRHYHLAAAYIDATRKELAAALMLHAMSPN